MSDREKGNCNSEHVGYKERIWQARRGWDVKDRKRKRKRWTKKGQSVFRNIYDSTNSLEYARKQSTVVGPPYRIIQSGVFFAFVFVAVVVVVASSLSAISFYPWFILLALSCFGISRRQLKLRVSEFVGRGNDRWALHAIRLISRITTRNHANDWKGQYRKLGQGEENILPMMQLYPNSYFWSEESIMYPSSSPGGRRNLSFA